MAIIGHNALLGSVAGFNLTNTKRLFGTTQQLVLPANQRLIAVHIGWAPGNGSASGSINVCLYDHGNASANKPIIAGTEINIPYDPATLGASARWISITGLDVDLSAHAGKTLGPGVAAPAASSDSGFSVLLGAVSGATRANSTDVSTTNPNPFVEAGTSSDQAWSLYFETETIGSSLSLDSVSPSSVTNVGQITGVISGNAASGTVNLKSGAISVSQSVVSWSYNGGTNKTTVVINVSQGGIPFGVVDVEYIVGGGGGTLTGSTTLAPISGSVAVNISGAQDDPGYIFEQLDSGDYLDIDQIEHTDSPNTVVLPSGLIEQTIVRSFSARARDSSDNTWGSFSDIDPGIPAAIAVVGFGLSVGLGSVNATGAASAITDGFALAISLGIAVASGNDSDGIASPSGVSCAISLGIVVVSGAAKATPSGLQINSYLGNVSVGGVTVVPSIYREFSVELSPVIYEVNLDVKKGDNRRIGMVLKKQGVVVDVSGWSNFKLGIDSLSDPTDGTTNVALVDGSLTSDGTDGRIYFPVPGDIDAGTYWYDAEGVDDNGEVGTFVEGRWKVREDRAR